jgi:hypothetical protein
MQKQANRELDARLERQDRERQQKLNAAIAEATAAKSAEQLADERAHLVELDAKAADEYRRHQEWLDRRRAERDEPFSTLGT